jgi:hypothetical protein
MAATGIISHCKNNKKKVSPQFRLIVLYNIHVHSNENKLKCKNIIKNGQSLFVASSLTTHYVSPNKIIHMYFKSHDLFNESCDFFK